MLRESTVARLGLVALALVEWRYAALLVWNGLLPLHPFAIGLLLVLYLTSFALLLKATANPEPGASRWWTLVPMLLAVTAFVYIDADRKATLAVYPTTDGHVYMDVAARFLVQGRNPYGETLIDGFRIYQLPVHYATPLVDGNLSERVAYPSLSFLVLVPFVLAKIPTYLVYGICFVAALLWLVKRVPWWSCGLVVALFLHDETFLSMSFGGVTDSVWLLCLLGAVMFWSKPNVAAVLVGLACSQKQHPWFFVPYFLIRLWDENGRTLSLRSVPVRFLGIAASVFVVLNLPFVLWAPKAWFLGIIEPLAAPMIQLSEGLSALSMTGYIFVPRLVTSILFWSVFAYSLWLYARHTSAIRDWCFILPAVVLWFGYRALMSYWYFNAILAVGALLANRDTAVTVLAKSWRITSRVGVALAAGVVIVLVVFAVRKPPFAAVLNGPIEAWDTHVFRMRLLVTSRSSKAAELRFTVQSTGNQPAQWIVDIGEPLAAGATAEFILRAPRPDAAFELGSGARISISDKADPSMRAFMTVEPEIAVNRVDRIPNPHFDVLDVRTLLPFGWGLERSDTAVRLDIKRGEAAFVFDEARDITAAPPSCFPAQRVGVVDAPSTRFGELFSTIELPLEDISLRVKVPNDANRAPWTNLYGVHLAMPGWNGYVLFDAPVDHGTLPSGAAFVSLPAPRETWIAVKLSLENLLRVLSAPSDSQRYAFLRFPDLDVPMHPVQVGLVATRPTGAIGDRVEFGGFSQSLAERDADAIIARSKPTPGRATWRAARELENDNPLKAADLLQQAVATEPTVERLQLLGDVELRAKRWDRARDAYTRALAFGSTPAIEKGLGWALIASDPKGAIDHLTRASESFAIIEKDGLRPKYLDTLCGLVLAYAKAGDCASSARYAEIARHEDPRFPTPPPPECH